MSQSENSNCFCQTISIEENTLTFLRISVNLLRLCASEPILYETTAPGHNDSIKKDTVWSKIAIDWQLYDPKIERRCQAECELIALVRNARKYLQIIAGSTSLVNYYDREEEKSHETSIESDVTDKNEIRKCLQVFADVLEYVSLHPMLYDPKHSDYNNDVEILTVWNYIYKVHKIKKNQDERVVDYGYNVRFAEDMLQRIAKPIIYCKQAPKTVDKLEKSQQTDKASVMQSGTAPIINIDHVGSISIGSSTIILSDLNVANHINSSPNSFYSVSTGSPVQKRKK